MPTPDTAVEHTSTTDTFLKATISQTPDPHCQKTLDVLLTKRVHPITSTFHLVSIPWTKIRLPIPFTHLQRTRTCDAEFINNNGNTSSVRLNISELTFFGLFNKAKKQKQALLLTNDSIKKYNKNALALMSPCKRKSSDRPHLDLDDLNKHMFIQP